MKVRSYLTWFGAERIVLERCCSAWTLERADAEELSRGLQQALSTPPECIDFSAFRRASSMGIDRLSRK